MRPLRLGARAEQVGVVSVTSLTADRIVGTFELTLVPQVGSSADGPLVLTNGSFDLGLLVR